MEPRPTQNGFLLRHCDSVDQRSALLVHLVKMNLNKISHHWSRSWLNGPTGDGRHRPQEPSRTDKRQRSFANGRIGRKEITNKPGVLSLPPGTLASSLRHRKHSAGWISVTKLSRGEALQQPGRDKAAYPQGRSTAALRAAGSFLPFTGCEFHLCEKIAVIL